MTMRFGARQPLMSRNATAPSCSPSSWMTATALGSGAGGSSLASAMTAITPDAANKATRLVKLLILDSRGRHPGDDENDATPGQGEDIPLCDGWLRSRFLSRVPFC